MRRQAVSWFHGWKITLKCTAFGCQDGTRRFASSAILQHAPTQADPKSLHWPDRLTYSRVHTEEAFWSCEDADTDALEKARRRIFELDGAQGFSETEVLEIASGTGVGMAPDEMLAARFEISFDGRRYAFRQHRYDHFKDALRYALAQHAEFSFVRDQAFQPRWLPAYRPSDDEENMMQQHGIAYVEGRFLYGGYRYGRLSDAVAFAKGQPNCRL
jgi:hypothetical protein